MNLRAAIALCGLLAATSTAAGTLEVHLDHLRPDGSLHVALYRDAATWRRQRGAYVERTLPHPGTSETLHFDNLPPGLYAVSARQDAVEEWLPQPLLLTLARRGDSGGGAMSRAVFERAAVRVEDADPSIRVHLFTDSRYLKPAAAGLLLRALEARTPGSSRLRSAAWRRPGRGGAGRERPVPAPAAQGGRRR